MTTTLIVNGQVYSTWTSVRVTRGLKRACADFELETPGEYIPEILPFMPCTIEDDGALVLTGYVDSVEPEVTSKSSRTVIRGRSKVMDLVDCMPEFGTNQFNGYALDAITRTVAAAFGINVVIGAGVVIGAPFADATFERGSKAFAFIERLARQRGVLLTDDPAGNMVMTTLGTAGAPVALVMGQGGNVFRARGTLDGKGRFLQYTVRAQAGIKLTQSVVQNAVVGIAYDPNVPRFRPWAGIAESAALTDMAQLRAAWEAAHRSGEAVKAVLSVPGWHAGGSLWQCNQMVSCDVPRLGLNSAMLIGEVCFVEDDERGRYTDLTVQPPAAFLPAPLKKLTDVDPFPGLINVVKTGA